ncbi:MAG TPA: ABC transporter permease [Candidatus Acidoferrum sp.]|nr:ABC transporter permease [Candidatus Acidoferrum sp.]
MHQLWQNLRYSLRALRKNPGFTTVAILSLALGIGANVAIFTLVNALLLRDLPVPHPERLVELSVVRRGDKIPFSYPMFRELDRGQRVLSSLVGWAGSTMPNVEVSGVFEPANVLATTSNFYSELDVAPFLGRLLTLEDVNRHAGSTSQVAVIGYEFWQRRFGGALDALGKQVRIDGQPFTIVGITRKWFTGLTPGEPPDVTVPITAKPLIEGRDFSLDNRAILWVFLTGRLKDGITIDQARAQLQSFWPEVLLATASTETPGLRRQTFLSMGLDASPVRTGFAKDLRAQFSRPLYLLGGIVGLILLVACVNLANLMLARAAARSQEMSVRVAIGASRWAVASQVLTESLVLSLGGALLGLVLSHWGGRVLVAFMTEGTVSLDLRPDLRVLSIALFVGVFTGILFGLAPTWHSLRQDPAVILQPGSRSLTGGASKLGKALIITQVALSLVLLLGAGLLVRSLRELRSLNLGFEKDNLLEVIPHSKPGGYENLDMNSYHNQLIERVSSIPGVRSVSFADISIPDPQPWRETASPTSEDPNTGAHIMASGVMIWPGFLKTLGIPLIAGRGFEAADDEHHPHLAIVSRSFSERLFVNGDAIGRHIRFGFMPDFQNLEIVGVAEDARILDLRDSAPPIVYLSYLQKQATWGDLYVRTKGNPEALAMTIGHEIESLGREYPMRAATVHQMVNRVLVNERVIALLSGFFAALALLLASIGLYGLMSYGVTRRTREIGVRVALGAQQGRVRWMILGETLALTLFGIAIGIPSGLAATRLIASMLFGLSPNDLSTIVTACLLLLVVGFVAGYLPARKASSIDPILALHTE